VHHTHAMDRTTKTRIVSPIDAEFEHAYPSLTGPELFEAKKNFCRYIEIAFSVVEDRAAGDRAIDTFNAGPMIKERSNRTPKI
jgi:hypothetical protein